MIGSGIADGIGTFIVFCIVVAVIVGASVVGGIWFFTEKDYIKSRTPIIPKKVLITDGTKVDTMYYYYPLKDQK